MLRRIQLITLLNLALVTNGFSQKTIFWEIKDTVNHKTSYLLGTYHIIGASFIDSFDIVLNALKNSSTAIFEVVDENKADRQIMQRRQESDSLQIILTKKQYSHLKNINPAWNDDYLQKLKPYELNLKLIMGVSMRVCGNYSKSDSMIYLDDYLESKSKKHGIKTIGLESGSEQIEVIETLKNKTWLSEREDIKKLIKIGNNGKYHPNLCDDGKAYIDFDLPYNFAEPCPNAFFLKVRNEKWMPKLITHLSSDNCFVAVGLLHLAYDCGIIVKLKEKGFVVTPITLK